MVASVGNATGENGWLEVAFTAHMHPAYMLVDNAQAVTPRLVQQGGEILAQWVGHLHAMLPGAVLYQAKLENPNY
jgi:hypothetical protein